MLLTTSRGAAAADRPARAALCTQRRNARYQVRHAGCDDMRATGPLQLATHHGYDLGCDAIERERTRRGKRERSMRRLQRPMAVTAMLLREKGELEREKERGA